MSKLLVTSVSLALLLSYGSVQADSHGDMQAAIDKLQQEKAFLLKRLNNSISFSKQRGEKLEELQTALDAEESKRMALSTRLDNAIAFSKTRGIKLKELQSTADSEQSKRIELSKRLNNAVSFSKTRGAQIEDLQGEVESEQSKRMALSSRLNNAIAFSKTRGEQIKELQSKVESEQSKRKALASRLDNAVSFSKARALKIEELSGGGNWAASTSASLNAAVAGIQGTTVGSNADNSVVVQVGNNGLFKPGGTALSASGKDLLSNIAKELSNVEGNLTVVGHSDNIPVGKGSRFSNNEALSFARAASTLQFLQGQGIPTERLSAAGYGANSPIASNDTVEGRQQNRRVEIFLRK